MPSGPLQNKIIRNAKNYDQYFLSLFWCPDCPVRTTFNNNNTALFLTSNFAKSFFKILQCGKRGGSNKSFVGLKKQQKMSFRSFPRFNSSFGFIFERKNFLQKRGSNPGTCDDEGLWGDCFERLKNRGLIQL